MHSTFGRCVLVLFVVWCALAACKKKSEAAAPETPPPTADAAATPAAPAPEADAATAVPAPVPPPQADAATAADAGPGGGSTIVIGGPASDDETRQTRTWLEAGIALAKEHKCEQALAEGFGKVLAFFEARHDPTKTKVRCGRTSVAGLGAGLEAALAGGDVTVLGPEWCDALFYQAYCLVELQRLPEAETALTRACEMMPGDPMYLAELGHVQQQQGKSEPALATFERALEAANTLAAEPDAAEQSPGGRPPVQWQTRALRGIGYAQVELGRLADARATYQRALELDPNDQQAKDELAFVEGKLGGAAP